MINEEFLREDFEGGQLVTGQDVADLLGMGEVYKKGKQMEAMDNEMKMEAKKKFVNIFNRMNEVAKRDAKDIID